MFTKKKGLFLLLCFSIFSLQAQIDLGGEDTAVGPLKPPAVSQVYDPVPWATAYSQGGHVSIAAPSVNQMGSYNYTLTSQPGETIDYKELNIFFFLEDYAVFQEYFLYQAYKKKRPISVENSDLAVFEYPVVRQYAVGALGYALNPKYINLIKSARDSAYIERFSHAKTVDVLYRKALDLPGSPTAHPIYLFEPSQHLFKVQVPSAVNELESAIQKAMTKEYARILREDRRSSESQLLSGEDLAAVVSEVSKTSVTRKEMKTVKELADKIGEQRAQLRKDYTSLLIAYTKGSDLLNEQEQIWFDWVIKSSKQILLDLDTVYDYLITVIELPNNATNYSHFININGLLREAQQRIITLPKAAEAKLVLDQLTANYLVKVKEDIVKFEDL